MLKSLFDKSITIIQPTEKQSILNINMYSNIMGLDSQTSIFTKLNASLAQNKVQLITLNTQLSNEKKENQRIKKILKEHYSNLQSITDSRVQDFLNEFKKIDSDLSIKKRRLLFGSKKHN